MKHAESLRSENRTKWPTGAPASRGLAPLRVSWATSSLGGNSRDRDRAHSQQNYRCGAGAVSWSAKSYLREGLRRTRTRVPDLFLVGLVELPASDLRHFSCAQRLPAERMITIVAHFRALVVSFIFGGRNSGQEKQKSVRPARKWTPECMATVAFNCSARDHG